MNLDYRGACCATNDGVRQRCDTALMKPTLRGGYWKKRSRRASGPMAHSFCILPLPAGAAFFTCVGRVAHKLAYYTVATVPFAFVFFLCRHYFPGWPGPSVLSMTASVARPAR